MLLAPKESQNLRKTTKRLAIFLPIVFLIDGFICFVLIAYAKLSTVLSGFIIIVITCVLYLLFYLLCAKIEEKKKKKLEKSGKKDPFSKKN